MRHLRLACLVLSLGLAALYASAAEGGFIATLSDQQQTEAGLARLSVEQQLALNTFVAREVSLARQGGVTAFAGTFSSRRKPEERTAAGLDLLSPTERDVLDRAVATAIATKPVPLTTVRRWREKDFAANRRFDSHGQVTFTVGRGAGGRDLVGGSVYTEVRDRESGVTLGVGVSSYRGDGWWGWPYDAYETSLDPFVPVGLFESPNPRGLLRGGPICGPRF